jgi:quercetin dioxygenase-like cupin family protein
MPRARPPRPKAQARQDGGLSALLRLQARLESEGYRVTLHLLAPGTSFAVHCACETRIDAVFAGQLQIVIEGEAHVLGPGDWQLVPAGASMSAEVVGDEPVLGLDAVRD